MNSTSLKTAVAAGVMAIAGATQAGESIEAKVNQGNAAWNAAFNASNADALAALYTAEAILVPPTGTTVKGTAAIREFWSGLFKAGFKDHKIDLIGIRQEGKLTIAVAKWQATGPDENGAPKQYGGQLVNILETQEDGQARSILHTWN
ncbi:MAG: SgcJ/EcaC family oxidoreductase [Methylophilaceae bacterium]|jgi:uncharacterized protein (TIGR02246 family)